MNRDYFMFMQSLDRWLQDHDDNTQKLVEMLRGIPGSLVSRDDEDPTPSPVDATEHGNILSAAELRAAWIYWLRCATDAQIELFHKGIVAGWTHIYADDDSTTTASA
jgi:hypothetical protein